MTGRPHPARREGPFRLVGRLRRDQDRVEGRDGVLERGGDVPPVEENPQEERGEGCPPAVGPDGPVGRADQPGAALEDRVPADVVEALRRLDQRVEILGPSMMDTGTTLAGVDPRHGTLFGTADVRRERFVVGS